ncbi:MAG: DUF5721 family protein [Vallitalea sp.]|nr:DUF5721 family protein [Vallitalea sp.]
MISFNITDIKLFMNNLFRTLMFDEFQVSFIELNTFTKFNISCDINKKFLSSDEIEINEGRELITWSEIKDIIYYIIKGNKTPTYMKIVFTLPKDKIADMVTKNNLNTLPNNINGLFINILYENNILKCTTGSSVNIFTLDKTLENYWDSSVKLFFKKHDITI